MSRAVRFDEYGGIDVLNVVEVAGPGSRPGPAAGPRQGGRDQPGRGEDPRGPAARALAGDVPVGPGLRPGRRGRGGGRRASTASQAGDEVIGFTDDRASQAELVVIDAENATRAPARASRGRWPGRCSWSAPPRGRPCARSTCSDGDTVVVSGAAGGVGSLAVQLARRAGATVIGLASEHNHEWLRGHGVVPVTYGDGVADRIREAAPDGVDAFIDTVGGGYVELALELGVAPDAHRHDRRLRGGRPSTASRPTATPPGRAPRRWPSWPRSSTRARSRSRSPRPIRWIRCATPTPSSSATTRAARSSSCPDATCRRRPGA